MNKLIYTTHNFGDRKISIKRAIAILAKNKIRVDENEATIILNILYIILLISIISVGVIRSPDNPK